MSTRLALVEATGTVFKPAARPHISVMKGEVNFHLTVGRRKKAVDGHRRPQLRLSPQSHIDAGTGGLTAAPMTPACAGTGTAAAGGSGPAGGSRRAGSGARTGCFEDSGAVVDVAVRDTAARCDDNAACSSVGDCCGEADVRRLCPVYAEAGAL